MTRRPRELSAPVIMFRLLVECYLGASKKLCQALWERLCASPDQVTIEYHLRAAIASKEPQWERVRWLLRQITPARLMRETEDLVTAGTIRRKDAIVFEENLLGKTAQDGVWK